MAKERQSADRHEEALAESLEPLPEPPPRVAGDLELHGAAALPALGRGPDAAVPHHPL
ncbi:hypothetical protein AB0P15_30040 [Streptomyces sp. NPDC087917]|uniref:hypothetical protein n=1 Tax=Streptomyces sp. NPDC087917 TaxID=3155060 RepID=UPI00343FF118